VIGGMTRRAYDLVFGTVLIIWCRRCSCLVRLCTFQ
jgi:hypothetical protein